MINGNEIQFILPENLNSLGVLGHLVTVNQSVHSDQIKCLEQYLSTCHINMEDTCLPAIIGGKDDALLFACALEAFGTENLPVQECLYYLLAELAYVDGFLDDVEEKILQNIQCGSKIAPERCASLLEQAHQDALSIRSCENVPFTRPYREAVTLKSLVLRLIRWLSTLFRKLFRLPIVKQEQEAEKDYISAIEKCAEIAKDDFSIIRPVYEGLISQCNDTMKELAELKGSLSQAAGISAEVAQVIASFADCISENVLNYSQEAHSELLQKERSLSDFTISLVGRTKAGKSTLHSVLTGQGQNRIGVGMQRTTRYNYVYQWNLLRLIDTPGIGSAEEQGREDDLIAASVLSGSDIICLLVVDDSILKDVLEFLTKLAALNKPIIILLNHKENIKAEVKFQKFISHPTDWLTSKGEDNLQGHIDRIRRYAQQEGFDSLLSVFPVFLLPALMAQEKKYAQYSKLLWECSNIDTFIEQLKVWITVFGPLKRSQTLIDGAIQSFFAAEQVISQGISSLQSKVTGLKQNKSAALRQIRKQQGILLKGVEQCLKDQYSQLETKHALLFAEDHWKDSGDLAPKWSGYLKRIGFSEDIEAEINSLVGNFSVKIDDAVREVFEDFYFSFQMSPSKISLHNSISFDFRSFANILGGLCGFLGSVALVALESNPIGWILTGAGIFIELISGRFKPKEKKRQEKIDKICRFLGDSIQKEASRCIADTVSQIQADTNRVIAEVEALFDHLMLGLDRAIEIGNDLTTAYAQQVNFFNTVFAWRILAFLMGTTRSYQEDAVNELVRGVERTDGKIKILTPAQVNCTLDPLKKVIAEEVEIVTVEV